MDHHKWYFLESFLNCIGDNLNFRAFNKPDCLFSEHHFCLIMKIWEPLHHTIILETAFAGKKIDHQWHLLESFAVKIFVSKLLTVTVDLKHIFFRPKTCFFVKNCNFYSFRTAFMEILIHQIFLKYLDVRIFRHVGAITNVHSKTWHW